MTLLLSTNKHTHVQPQVDSYHRSCWTGLPEDLCANPTGQFTTRTDSLVGRASIMIADDAGSIPAQSPISMTFVQKYVHMYKQGHRYISSRVNANIP